MQNNLLIEIKRQLPNLPKRQKSIGQYILKNKEKSKSISLQELCAKCQTSEPVVFAFCRRLGYSGFKDFKTALAENIGADKKNKISLFPVLDLEIADSDLYKKRKAEEFIPLIGGMYQRSIQNTLKSLDVKKFKQAVKQVNRAKRIVLLGVGISGNVGFVLLQNFLRTGIATSWVNDPNLFFTNIAPLKKGDVVIALSQTGNLKDTADAVLFAKERGITVIAISSDPECDIALNADLLLLTGPSPESYDTHLSIGAQIALPVLMVGDALAVAVGLMNFDAVLERSKATKTAIQKRISPRKRKKAKKKNI